MSNAEVNEAIRNFILNEFLPGEDPANLLDSTPLIASGILDSLATMRLVAFLEEKYPIQIGAHETDAEYMGSVESIEKLVTSKLS